MSELIFGHYIIDDWVESNYYANELYNRYYYIRDVKDIKHSESSHILLIGDYDLLDMPPVNWHLLFGSLIELKKLFKTINNPHKFLFESVCDGKMYVDNTLEKLIKLKPFL